MGAGLIEYGVSVNSVILVGCVKVPSIKQSIEPLIYVFAVVTTPVPALYESSLNLIIE